MLELKVESDIFLIIIILFFPAFSVQNSNNDIKLALSEVVFGTGEDV